MKMAENKKVELNEENLDSVAGGSDYVDDPYGPLGPFGSAQLKSSEVLAESPAKDGNKDNK